MTYPFGYSLGPGQIGFWQDHSKFFATILSWRNSSG
jgi:hypothetical protein